MNGIKSFQFYDNYYLLINTLDEEKQKIISLAILKYMFEDIEPNFDNDRQLYGIWVNLKMPLDTSKKNIENGKKGGRPKKSEIESEIENQKKPKPKPKPKAKAKANNISIFLFLFSNLYISNLSNKDDIYSLFKEYLELRKKNKYTLTETVVKRLINKLNEYGKTDEEKIEIITRAINGAWKDFYPLKSETHTKVEIKPSWYGKEIEEDKASEDEIKELEARLK